MSLTAYRQAGKTEIQSVDPDHPLPVTLPSSATPATPVSAVAQDSTGAMKAPIYTYISSQLDLTITTSTALTVPAGTRFAIIQAKGTASVKYRYDGATTAPTASVGITLPAGSELLIDIGQAGIAAMRFIQSAATTVLDVSYFS
jgi:hypothetical protein